MINGRSIEILMAEDSPGDVVLTRKALEHSKLKINLHAVSDGVEAMKFLRQEGEYSDVPKPDIVFLDLNMPRKDGREVLAEIKTDSVLKHIPVVILTTSDSEQDIENSYDLNANCYITKPVDMDQFVKVVSAIEDFWFTIVKLPGNGR
ncbi:Response regulator rcp1 [Halioglobus japonicus]|nr:Response regulator rcp1 [Halioglobus japonicus]